MSNRELLLALTLLAAAAPAVGSAATLHHGRPPGSSASPPHDVDDPAALWLALAAAEQGRAPAKPGPALPRLQTRSAPLTMEPPAPAGSLSLAGAERRRAITCLAAAIHYEAANQPIEGQEAVAQVVLNRVNMPGYPKSVCGVVFQGAERRTGCQFTFTCDGSMARRPTAASIRRAEAVAERVLDGHVSNVVGPATNYHTVWVHPYWSGSLVRISQVGAHIFYHPHGLEVWRPGLGPAYAGGELTVRKASLLDDRFGGEGTAFGSTIVAQARAEGGQGFSLWGISVAALERPASSMARRDRANEPESGLDSSVRNGW